MEAEDADGRAVTFLREKCGEGDLGMATLSGKPGEEATLLQWGQKKRLRCNRSENKHTSLADESLVLPRKSVRVNIEKLSGTSGKGLASEKEGSGVVLEQQHPRLPPLSAEPDDERKRLKILRGVPDQIKPQKGKCALRHVTPHTYNRNEHLPHQTKMCTSPNLKVPSYERNGLANSGHMGISTTQIEFSWPKILISLSRKEKEDDFLTIKGTKLPQRPKRRLKAVEKALHFCTPGIWLSDLSEGRYEVREKKCVKKKPRGLKAMESMDSDSQ